MRSLLLVLLFSTVLCAQLGPLPSGGSGGGAATPLNFRILCQGTLGTLAGSPYSEPASSGATHSCDSAWSGADGYEFFANGSTSYALLGPFNLSSSFKDPLTVTLWFNSSSTSGSFAPGIAALCVASGGAITTTWWTSASYTGFTSTATSGTAGVPTQIAALSYSTGCAANSLLYLAIRATSAATPAAGAGIKLLTIAGIQ